MTVCDERGCKGRVHGRGLCTKHYQRLRKHGSTKAAPWQPRSGHWRLGELDLAYAAGFIDADGTVGLRRVRRPQFRGGFSYEPYVTVGGTKALIPCWLYDAFGGNFRERETNFGGNARPVIYVWMVRSRTAVEVCRLVAPFLRLKKMQADEMVAQFAKRTSPGGRRPYDAAYWKHLEHIYQTMRSWNARGVA